MAKLISVHQVRIDGGMLVPVDFRRASGPKTFNQSVLRVQRAFAPNHLAKPRLHASVGVSSLRPP
jgi:hypothetical protein